MSATAATAAAPQNDSEQTKTTEDGATVQITNDGNAQIAEVDIDDLYAAQQEKLWNTYVPGSEHSPLVTEEFRRRMLELKALQEQQQQQQHANASN